MSEITLTIIKVLFLALLWLFILSAVSVIRSDLFGKPVPSSDPQAQPLESPAPPGKTKRSKRPKGDPRVFSITGGHQAGMSADLVDGLVLIGRSADCQLILDDDYGQRITAPTTITMSDTVRIGKSVMKLEP